MRIEPIGPIGPPSPTDWHTRAAHDCRKRGGRRAADAGAGNTQPPQGAHYLPRRFGFI